MAKPNRALVTAQELEALLGGSDLPSKKIDRYFPHRMLFLVVLASAYIACLIFIPEKLAQNFTSNPILIHKLTSYFYVRGFMLLFVMLVGVYSYTKAWYTALIFYSLALISSSNFFLDIFDIYIDKFSNPTIGFTLVFLLRLAGWAFIITNVLKCKELPAIQDRWRFGK